MDVKVYARMTNDEYRSLVPDFPYEVDYRISDNYVVLKGSPARYHIKGFVFTTENGILIDKNYLYRFLQSKNEIKRRGWKRNVKR